MTDNKSIFCDACQESVTHADRFIHQNSKHHKYKAVQLANFKRKVIITEYIDETIRNEFLEFLGECFGKIRMFHCFSTRKMIITFETIESAERCMSSNIIYDGNVIIIRKPYQQAIPVATVSPKIDEPSLSYDFEGKLEEQLNELLTQIEPKPGSVKKLERLVQHFQTMIKDILPGCVISPFGSVNTGLASHDSDVDLFGYLDYKQIQHLTNGHTEEEFHKSIIRHLRKFLLSHKNVFADVVGIANASVPIVKFTHLMSGLKCDLSFKGGYGVYNTLLLREMIATDSRIRPILMFLKHWAKTHEIIMVGCFSSYAIVMLVIYYFQTISPPLLPTIKSLQENKNTEVLINNWNCGFDKSALNSFKTENHDTIISLLRGFFQMCSEFQFEKYVITPYIDEKFSINLFKKLEDFPPIFSNYVDRIKLGKDKLPLWNSICIRDPFVHSRNITGGVNQAKLNYFRTHCKLAADTMNELDTERHLLKKLLQQNVPIPHKEFSRHKKALPTRICLPNQEKKNFEKDKMAYLNTLKLKIEKILSYSFRCEYKVMDESHYDQDGKTEFNFTYNCAMIYNTWENRKMYNKKKPKDRLNREKIVTDAMISNIYEDIKPDKPLFKCNIIFKLANDYLEFSNECAEFNPAYDQSYHYMVAKLTSLYHFF